MSMRSPVHPARGADNLLIRSIGVKSGDTLLLVEEPEPCSRYDPAVADCIAEQAVYLGLSVERCKAELISDPADFPAELLARMTRVDHTVFLSRLGDYCRFTALEARCSKTICYVKSLEMLGSEFSATCNRLFSELLNKFEQELLAGNRWRIHCPLGTDIQGTFRWPSGEDLHAGDFSMNLFPVTTFIPVPCDTAHGRVALSRWLVPGAAAKVEPAYIPLDAVTFAEVEDGEITGFSGERKTVDKINRHYDHVAGLLGVTRNRVHSWHAGVNPFTSFHGDISLQQDLRQWEDISFASPRYLHFHTCGDIPPCEIAWSLFNPSVTIDDEAVWRDGQFLWFRRPDNLALLKQSPDGDALLRQSADIGIG
jgi:hypothetical protein